MKTKEKQKSKTHCNYNGFFYFKSFFVLTNATSLHPEERQVSHCVGDPSGQETAHLRQQRLLPAPQALASKSLR